eukprot:CAMPEP_0113531206 /NCGR_PEP_ID=MMETSP0015_2-20120614/3370_1 /TAXON_ID=2838 /ORGANISM="Odontella" /LENGTH=812 /DNA_ID=CAMNT_0000430021 /DNA_START=39 /DNA_END=2477 /DNA_ORIENTATION=- /assembly_acc=CAM_ASM_000160
MAKVSKELGLLGGTRPPLLISSPSSAIYAKVVYIIGTLVFTAVGAEACSQLGRSTAVLSDSPTTSVRPVGAAFATAVTMSSSGPTGQGQVSSNAVPSTSDKYSFNNIRGDGGGLYPNWRIHRRSADGTCSSDVSPFCHSSTSEAPTSAAPWSNEAFRDALDLYEQLYTCNDSYIGPLIRDALHVLEQTYRLYGPYSVVGSYNGGKDAVVILNLMRAAHAKFQSDEENQREDGRDAGELGGDQVKALPFMTISRPRVIYFDHKDEFPEVQELLHNTVSRFDLDMVAFEEGIKFGEGLQVLVDTNYLPDNFSALSEHCRSVPPHPMAFVLGTRTSDPNAGSQGKFAPSSHYMPPFMRVNPILEWSYGHVWHFLRLFQLPYCSLYDKGYTSLGTVKDTLPCPALAKPPMSVSDQSQSGRTWDYWPAFMLRDWDQERAGRISKKVQLKTPTISQSSSTVSLQSGANKEGSSGDKDFNTTAAIEPPTGSDDESSLGSLRRQRTVGLIIIGDEILKGLTSDTNTKKAAMALHEHNVPLARVVVVSDDLDEIVQEIQRMREEVDVIVTSGGVGPTHDDVTMKSVAAAVGREMVLHDEMARLLIEKMDRGDDDLRKNREDVRRQQEDLTEAQIKMATLPSGSRLRYLTNDKSEWPVLQCGPIFVLPGVPQFFEKKICALANYLSSELERSVSCRVVLSIDETSIVSCLNMVVQRHPNVAFGSYPFVGHPETKTVVTLEGRLIEGGYTRNSGRFLERTRSSPSSSGNIGHASTSVIPPAPLLFTKEEMDLNVETALADLLSKLPDGSVLRVDNNDDLNFDH